MLKRWAILPDHPTTAVRSLGRLGGDTVDRGVIAGGGLPLTRRQRFRADDLTMAFDDPTMDDDLREVPAAHEIVLGEEWADGRPCLGVVCATEADDGLNNG